MFAYMVGGWVKQDAYVIKKKKLNKRFSQMHTNFFFFFCFKKLEKRKTQKKNLQLKLLRILLLIADHSCFHFLMLFTRYFFKNHTTKCIKLIHKHLVKTQLHGN
jgi:hypothetical protein